MATTSGLFASFLLFFFLRFCSHQAEMVQGQKRTAEGVVVSRGRSMIAANESHLPATGRFHLEIVVPLKPGFTEFVNVSENAMNITGYCVDVFEAVVKALPSYKYKLTYELVPLDVNYDELVWLVHNKTYNAAIGDITILANRSLLVDFTLPYSDSGVSMLVPLKTANNKGMLIFLKPLTLDLWLGGLALFLVTGFIVWLIEHTMQNEDFCHKTFFEHVGIIVTFSAMVFENKGKLKHPFSKILVVAWLFLFLAFTTSYTANLASMFTTEQIKPAVTDVQQLKMNGDCVGFQSGIVKNMLLTKLGFNESNLKGLIGSAEEYETALNNATAKGVTAIFDEIPYIKVFLKTRCNKYAMVGPIYNMGGFGFVFPKNQSLVSDFSTAVINVTEFNNTTSNNSVATIEQNYFGLNQVCSNQINSHATLGFMNFGGLFIIMGILLIIAILIIIYQIIWCQGERATGSTAVRDGNEERMTGDIGSGEYRTTEEELIMTVENPRENQLRNMWKRRNTYPGYIEMAHSNGDGDSSNGDGDSSTPQI